MDINKRSLAFFLLLHLLVQKTFIPLIAQPLCQDPVAVGEVIGVGVIGPREDTTVDSKVAPKKILLSLTGLLFHVLAKAQEARVDLAKSLDLTQLVFPECAGIGLAGRGKEHVLVEQQKIFQLQFLLYL